MASVYNINRLVLIIDIDCIFCEVRTEILSTLYMNSMVLTQLISGLSSRRAGFDPRPVRLRFMVGEVEMGQIFLFEVFASQYHSKNAPYLNLHIIRTSSGNLLKMRRSRTSVDVRQKSTFGVEMYPVGPAAWHLDTGFLRCRLLFTKY